LSSKWSPNGLLFTSKVVSIWSPMETFSSLPISSQPWKCQNTYRKISCYSSVVGSTWCIMWPKLFVVRPTHCVMANTMGCVAWWFG
jgi:hypothetical protein